MYSTDRLYRSISDGAVPFTMALSTPTHFDVDVILTRGDGLTYRPDLQRNEDGAVTMGSSTCHRRGSTGIIFTDNDRQQDD